MLAKFRSMWRMRSNREEIYSRPEFWDQKAKVYQGTAVSMFVNVALNERYQREQFRFFDDALGTLEGREVLDVGCGTGRLSRHLAAQGAKVWAFDFAQEAVNLARESSAGMDIEYSVGSVFEFHEDARYDDIVVLGCLSAACKDRDEFLRVVYALRDALRPGGRLVLIEPFHAGFLRRVLRLSGSEVEEILKEAGLEVYLTRELHFWPIRLLLTLGNVPAFITVPLYHVGRAWLAVLSPFGRGGDYKGIAAVRSHD